MLRHYDRFSFTGLYKQRNRLPSIHTSPVAIASRGKSIIRNEIPCSNSAFHFGRGSRQQRRRCVDILQGITHSLAGLKSELFKFFIILLV
jgi:hypothetical protein